MHRKGAHRAPPSGAGKAMAASWAPSLSWRAYRGWLALPGDLHLCSCHVYVQRKSSRVCEGVLPFWSRRRMEIDSHVDADAQLMQHAPPPPARRRRGYPAMRKGHRKRNKDFSSIKEVVAASLSSAVKRGAASAARPQKKCKVQPPDAIAAHLGPLEPSAAAQIAAATAEACCLP